MADVSTQILQAAVGYAVDRLRTLATAEQLRDLTQGVLPDEPGLSELRARVAAASEHVDAAAAAGATSPPDLHQAGARVWAAFGEMSAAGGLLGVADSRPAVRRLLDQPPIPGLIARLGLSKPAVTIGADGLTVLWSRDSPPSPVPGTTLARVSVGVSLGTEGISAVLAAGGFGFDLAPRGDKVLTSMLGSAAKVTADLDLGLSPDGLSSQGGAGPVILPARADFGVADLEGLELTLRRQGGSVGVGLGARVRGEFGPLQALVDGLGILIPIDVAAMLAGEPFALSDTAVRGVGLSLDLGLVVGGGFLSRTARDDGVDYGGVLELQLGPVQVKAFGLLRDRAGASSFVAVMSVELSPAMELGLGFTLNGVGGMVGQGVTIDTKALAAGLHDGVLGRVLFPPDPVAAAPTILATLAQVFPARVDGFVVGPMLALGWGRPTLVRLDIAVALALPDPVVVVLGRARAAFPLPEAPVIDLKASLLAQFGGGIVLVRAELEDSRVGLATVQGGFGMLARFDATPTFVVSAGGFHPRFTQIPPELAGIGRITAELAPPVGLQMRLSGYVALTPNTLQLGGTVEIGYSLAVVAVRGSLAMDALVHFDPFAVEVDVSAKVSVEAFGESVAGVDLHLHLRGPSPWVVRGTGRVRLPWPLPDPSIDIAPDPWGDTAPEPPSRTVRPLDEAVRELSAPAAWSRQERPGFSAPVRLASLPANLADDPTLTPVEPWALLRASQRLVPLGLRLDRMGTNAIDPPSATVSFAGDPTVQAGPDDDPPGDAALRATWSQVREAFATAQYVDLADDQALTAPDFEQRSAGILLDPSRAHAVPEPAVEASLTYEDFHPYDEGLDAAERSPLWALIEGQSLAVALGRTATATAALRGADRYRLPPRPLAVQPSSAVRVADLATFATLAEPDAAVTGLAAGFAPWTDAAASAADIGLGSTHLTKTGV